jgi:peroxiredoxin Q/BCP
MLRAVVLTLSVFAFLAAPVLAADDNTVLKVKEGDKLPDVELPASQPGKLGAPKPVKLSEFQGPKGKNVVLFFYPKAMTGGCTTECKAFRDDLSKFTPLDTVVFGISTDTNADQDKFIEKESLTFPLLADPDQKLTKALGVVSPKNAKVSQRVTFVVDKQGVVRKVFTDVKPAGHAAEVRAFIEKELTDKK